MVDVTTELLEGALARKLGLDPLTMPKRHL
jgi:hypothetical protein